MKIMCVSTFELFGRHWFFLLSIAALSYLIGSVNFAVIISKYFFNKSDVRTLGSGNAGFTNMLRTVGKRAGTIIFIADFLKGIGAVLLSKFLITFLPEIHKNSIFLLFILVMSSFMCALGHAYPCFFGFKGGKSILTTWATLLFIDYKVFCIVILVFLVVLLISKIVSLSSISAAIAYPITFFCVLYPKHISNNAVCQCCKQKSELLIFLIFLLPILLASFIIYKHKSNILRILNGTEKKIKIK